MVDCLQWCVIGTLRGTISAVLINVILSFIWGYVTMTRWGVGNAVRFGGNEMDWRTNSYWAPTVCQNVHLVFIIRGMCSILAPLSWWWNGSSERLTNIPKILNLISYKGEIWIQVSLMLIPSSCYGPVLTKVSPRDGQFLCTPSPSSQPWLLSAVILPFCLVPLKKQREEPKRYTQADLFLRMRFCCSHYTF